MNHRAAVVVPFILLLPLFVDSAAAQSGFAGVVKDPSGAVLPGVTVEARSPVLIEGVRTGDHRQRRPVPHRRLAARSSTP